MHILPHQNRLETIGFQLYNPKQVGDNRLSALIIQNRLETIGFHLLLSKTDWRQQVISSIIQNRLETIGYQLLLSKTGWRPQVFSSIIKNRLETIGFQLYYPYDITQQKLFFHNSHTLQQAPFICVMFSIKYMLHVFFTTIAQALSKTNPLILTCVYTGISQ